MKEVAARLPIIAEYNKVFSAFVKFAQKNTAADNERGIAKEQDVHYCLGISKDGKTATVTVAMDQNPNSQGMVHNECNIGMGTIIQDITIDLAKDVPKVTGATFSQAFSADIININPGKWPESARNRPQAPPERLERLYRAKLEGNDLFRDTGGPRSRSTPPRGASASSASTRSTRPKRQAPARRSPTSPTWPRRGRKPTAISATRRKRTETRGTPVTFPGPACRRDETFNRQPTNHQTRTGGQPWAAPMPSTRTIPSTAADTIPARRRTSRGSR